MATKATKTTPAVANEPKQRIYIGPNLPALTKYTVVENEYPVHIAAVIEKKPVVDKLFVPVTTFAQAEQRVTTAGTLENKYYNELLKDGE